MMLALLMLVAIGFCSPITKHTTQEKQGYIQELQTK